jgi:Tfp pilus assembly protein PilN
MSRHLNLLPWNVRRSALLRERLRQWCTAWGTIVVIAVGLGCWQLQRLSSTQAELAFWQVRSERARSDEALNADLQGKINQLKARLAKYGHFESERTGFLLISTLSQAAAVNSGKLQVQKLNFATTVVTETPPAGRQPATNNTPAPTRKHHVMSLSGVASSNLVLSQFVSSLRDSAAFEKVELKSSQGKGEVAAGPRAYQIECRF